MAFSPLGGSVMLLTGMCRTFHKMTEIRGIIVTMPKITKGSFAKFQD